MKDCRGSLWGLRLGITNKGAARAFMPNGKCRRHFLITSESANGTLPPNAMGITSNRRRRLSLMRWGLRVTAEGGYP